MSYDASEQGLVLEVFKAMFASVTKDGGTKRARGEKPPWWRDPAHEAAIYSHLNKWKHGERQDADSGAHPLVHLAWRAMAIAYQETYGKVDPAPEYMRQMLGLPERPEPGTITLASRDVCVRPDCPGFGMTLDSGLCVGRPTLDVGDGPKAMVGSRTGE